MLRTLWQRLFRKPRPLATAAAAISLPQPGEKWFFNPSNDGPWEHGRYKKYRVTILDVKDDWVRYSMAYFFQDERRTIKSFLSMYKKMP